MADLFDLREVVTGKFYERHVVLVRELDLSELDEVAKKLAEGVYQARGVAVSSVVVLGWREALALKTEVKARQAMYEQATRSKVRQDFLTVHSYPHLERGAKRGTPAAKKRATYLGLCRFRYGVLPVEGEHGPRFKIDHHGGVE